MPAPAAAPVDSTLTPSSETPGLPASGVRTAISYLLFIHLVALAMSIVGHLPPTSPLRTQLGELPLIRNYTELLAMNTGYNYHLTYGLGEDTPQFIELIPPGGDQEDMLVFSADGVFPGLRQARYRRLLFNAYDLAIRQVPNASLLSKQIAQSVIYENGLQAADTGQFRFIIGHRNLLPPQMILSADPLERDPLADRLVENVYEVDLWYADNQMYVNEVTAASEGSALKSEQPDSAEDK